MAFDISGTAYADEGVTPLGEGLRVDVSVNGAASAANTTTAIDGTFTLASITAAANAVLTVYLQGNTEVGVCVTKSTNAAMTGVDIYQNGLNIRSDNSVVTGTNINTSDNNGDTGITAVYSSSANNAFALASGMSLYVQAGQTLQIGSSTVATVPGSFSNRGTLTNGQIVFTGSGTIRCNGGSFTGFTLNAPSGLYTLADNAGLGVVTLTDGTLDVTASDYTITTLSNWGGTSGVFVCRSGTVVLNHTNNLTRTINGTPGPFFNLVHQGTVAIYQLTGDVNVTNDLTISTGSIDPNGSTLSVVGNLIATSGIISGTTGSVALTGTGGSTQTISGSHTFPALTATGSSARTLTITDGTTQTVSNSLTLKGAAGQLLTIQGSGAAGYTLAVPATQDIDYVSVSHCTATGNPAIAKHGVDGGNNVNWVFPPAFTVTPSCDPTTGTTATTFTFDPGTITGGGTLTYSWEYRADGSADPWTEFSTDAAPEVLGSVFGAGVWATRLTVTNAADEATATGDVVTVTSPPPSGGGLGGVVLRERHRWGMRR